jgi:hypothetical protein
MTANMTRNEKVRLTIMPPQKVGGVLGKDYYGG